MTIEHVESRSAQGRLMTLWHRVRIFAAMNLSIAVLGGALLAASSIVLTETAEAATACPLGQELYTPSSETSGSCYKCDDGFSRTLFTEPTDSDACERINEATKTTATRQGDSSFVCQSGEFPDLLTGKCYTCPTDYDWNVITGKCEFTDNTTASFAGNAGTCDVLQGEWDGGGNRCYKCSSGSRIPFTNKCSTTSTSLTSGTETDCTTVFGVRVCTGCSCPSGYSTNVFPACTASDKCIKTTTTQSDATFLRYIGCAPGTFPGGISGKCYSCPRIATTACYRSRLLEFATRLTASIAPSEGTSSSSVRRASSSTRKPMTALAALRAFCRMLV